MNSDGGRNVPMEGQAFNAEDLFNKMFLSCCCDLGFVLVDQWCVGLVSFWFVFFCVSFKVQPLTTEVKERVVGKTQKFRLGERLVKRNGALEKMR